MEKGKNTRKGFSFRSQLMLFCFLLVLLIAVPVLVIEVQRPWQALNQLITQSKIVVSDLQSKFETDELTRLNNFTFKIADSPAQLDPQYLTWSFGILMARDSLLSEQEVRQVFKENNVAVTNFDYAKLEQTFRFWQEQFFNDPGIIFIFRAHKQEITDLVKSVNESGFNIDDAYLMADNGKALYFILDGSAWYESTYPGQKYDVIANDCPYFRAYLQNGPGFDHDPIHYAGKIFPKFNTDQWGTWFSVWLSQKELSNYNVFSLDLDASGIKKLMWAIGGLVLGIALCLILLVILVTDKLSSYLAKPIEKLVSGTEAIMQGNFEHQVEISGSREFAKLINFFNQMIANLKERLNMKQTLEKLLSQELADQVAKHGLVLGGQKVNVTILFTDFAGFTPNTRNMMPEQVVAMLNEYFGELIPIIKKWGGLPDKFIGDAIVAMFGAPVLLDNHAESAVCAAIEMQLKIHQLNLERSKNNKPILEMRVGLNSGEVIAGTIGSDLKLEYTAIGETANLANRMESMCTIGHILIAENTFALIRHIFFENIDIDLSPQQLQVKGYDLPISAYNLYVSQIGITKNEALAGTDGYYQYSATDYHLKKSATLTASEKAKYQKFVQIKVS
ncbi:MAG: adenylate/guanylate cyclase domain-containing protein [Candidatus Parcubacteria bacterium]|nr:adenylate/guanylate cyclase domain-containing protein [Candidatus Parcubacteria bacterium]